MKYKIILTEMFTADTVVNAKSQEDAEMQAQQLDTADLNWSSKQVHYEALCEGV